MTHYHYTGITMAIGENDKKRVLVEEGSYGKPWVENPEEPQFETLGKEIFNHVQELAFLL